jgi:glycosyltransferase involved in cell wall biosynthesis
LLLLFERLSYRCADAVLVVNESLREVAIGRGRVRPAAVTIVGNGPVLDRARANEPAAVAREPGGRRLRCVWVGLMGPQDGLHLLVETLAEMVHGLHRRDCEFVLIGDGETRVATAELAEKLGVAEWITFTGWLDEADVFRQLAAADIGVDPNLEEFVSPVKVMEYMAFGLPVVAFDLRETRNLARDAAAYAAPGDVPGLARTLVEVLDDAPRRAAMGTAGIARVRESVAWEHQAARLLDVYRRLLRLEPAEPLLPGTAPGAAAN